MKKPLPLLRFPAVATLAAGALLCAGCFGTDLPPASGSEGRKVRFSPKSLVKFRKKYSLSQKALAILLGVTPFTVSHWEIGKNRPRLNQIEAISALAKLGKRKLFALVAEKAPGEIPAQKPVAGKKVKAAAPAKKAVKAVAKKVAKVKKAAVAAKPAAPAAKD